jgi:Bacterial extracellular solute-binding proteins, family 5 Middle.
MVGEYNYDNLPNEILEKISSGLLYIDFRGQLIPLLVNSWEVGDNGKKYRFYLKNGILWNDGKSFSALDINYQFKNIKVKIIDERTIDFYLDQPSAIFPLLLAKPIFRHPLIGVAGLYRVGTIKTKYGKINEIQLIPNKKDIPILIYKFYESETKLITAYKLGEVNRIKIYKKNIAEKFKKWKNTTVEKLVDYSQLVVLLINHKNELLKEKEINMHYK